MSVSEMLSQLEEVIHQMANLQATMQALKDEVTPAEIKAQLLQIEEEFEDKIDSLKKREEELEKQIRAEALESGEGAVGSILQVVVAQREKWDREVLKKISDKFPEILNARSLEPFVQIRKQR